MINNQVFVSSMSLTIPNLVPQRPFCYLNFISVAKPQKIGNETYDAHVLTSSKTVSSSFLGLGRAAVCDCGTPWTFLLPFFIHKAN